MDITLSPEHEAQLDDLVARSNHSKGEVITDALIAYLDHERWFADAVAQGQRSAREGRLISHDDVGRMLRKRSSS